MALLKILAALQGRLGLSLVVANVHHGPSADSALAAARSRARDCVASFARSLDLEFVTLGWSERDPQRQPCGSGENELREFRLQSLEAFRAEHGFDRVAFAHHWNDLLETRLIRLLRGTGPDGLAAMSFNSGTVVRPFLSTPREAILAYAERTRLEWVEDPSNQSREPLRNWLRHELLPAIEAKRPGSVEACARSLEHIVVALHTKRGESSALWDAVWGEGGLDRLVYDTLSIEDRRWVLALYLKRLGARGLGRSHLEEIVKRLDTDQKSPTFRVGGWVWKINAGQIRAEPATDPQSC